VQIPGSAAVLNETEGHETGGRKRGPKTRSEKKLYIITFMEGGRDRANSEQQRIIVCRVADLG